MYKNCKRKFKPGVYRLFKDDRPLEERMYYAFGIVKPCEDLDNVTIVKCYEAAHTEIENASYGVILLANGDFVSPIIDEPLVFYKALYGKGILYVRPYDMFMSLADKKKYPQFKQKYRFELLEDDYRFKPVKWDIKTNDFTKDIGYLYIGELRIVISASEKDGFIILQFDIADENGSNVTSYGIFFDDGGYIEIECKEVISVNEFKKLILNHVYDYIEAYEDDTLRIKANSSKEIKW